METNLKIEFPEIKISESNNKEIYNAKIIKNKL